MLAQKPVITDDSGNLDPVLLEQVLYCFGGAVRYDSGDLDPVLLKHVLYCFSGGRAVRSARSAVHLLGRACMPTSSEAGGSDAWSIPGLGTPVTMCMG